MHVGELDFFAAVSMYMSANDQESTDLVWELQINFSI